MIFEGSKVNSMCVAHVKTKKEKNQQKEND